MQSFDISVVSVCRERCAYVVRNQRASPSPGAAGIAAAPAAGLRGHGNSFPLTAQPAARAGASDILPWPLPAAWLVHVLTPC